MPRTTQYRYPWPASAITPAEMHLLYEARERSVPRIPISQLIAAAVREVYAQMPVLSLPDNRAEEERKAA